MSTEGTYITYIMSKHAIEKRGIDVNKKLMEHGFVLNRGISYEDTNDQITFRQYVSKPGFKNAGDAEVEGCCHA